MASKGQSRSSKTVCFDGEHAISHCKSRYIIWTIGLAVLTHDRNVEDRPIRNCHVNIARYVHERDKNDLTVTVLVLN